MQDLPLATLPGTLAVPSAGRRQVPEAPVRRWNKQAIGSGFRVMGSYLGGYIRRMVKKTEATIEGSGFRGLVSRVRAEGLRAAMRRTNLITTCFKLWM